MQRNKNLLWRNRFIIKFDKIHTSLCTFAELLIFHLFLQCEGILQCFYNACVYACVGQWRGGGVGDVASNMKSIFVSTLYSCNIAIVNMYYRRCIMNT